MAETTPAADAAGGLPQFDTAWWGSQIFWLVVTFGVLYFALSRFILPRLGSGISERGDRIADDLDAASRMQQEAEAAETQYQTSLADARAKAHKINATTKSSVDAEIASEVETAEAEFTRQSSAAEARIAKIRAEALRNVDEIAADTASEIVSKLSGMTVTAASAKTAVSKA